MFRMFGAATQLNEVQLLMKLGKTLAFSLTRGYGPPIFTGLSYATMYDTETVNISRLIRPVCTSDLVEIRILTVNTVWYHERSDM